MTDVERRGAAAKFAEDWKDRGDEKQETSLFWIALLQKVYGVEEKNYGKVSMGVVRSTFIIDENCIIEKVMPKVRPDTNATEILAYLREKGCG